MFFMLVFLIFIYSSELSYSSDTISPDQVKKRLTDDIELLINKSTTEELYSHLENFFKPDDTYGMQVDSYGPYSRRAAQIMKVDDTIFICFCLVAEDDALNHREYRAAYILCKNNSKYFIKQVTVFLPSSDDDAYLFPYIKNIGDINKDNNPDMLIEYNTTGNYGPVEIFLFLSGRERDYQFFKLKSYAGYMTAGGYSDVLYSGEVINGFLVIINNKEFDETIEITNDIEFYRFAVPQIDIYYADGEKLIKAENVPGVIYDKIDKYFVNFIDEHKKDNYSRVSKSRKKAYFQTLQNERRKHLLKYKSPEKRLN